MKICTVCGVESDETNFSPDNRLKSGLRSNCKQCGSKRNLKCQRTLYGHLSKIYFKQKRSSKERGHVPPNYTKNEFINWCLMQPNFYKLFFLYRFFNRPQKLSPSGDRVNPLKPYSLDNIEMMSWWENNKLAHKDRSSGKDGIAKQVYQVSKSGKIINRYHSLAAGAKANNTYTSNIIRSINTGCRAGGTYWKYVG